MSMMGCVNGRRRLLHITVGGGEERCSVGLTSVESWEVPWAWTLSEHMPHHGQNLLHGPWQMALDPWVMQ